MEDGLAFSLVESGLEAITGAWQIPAFREQIAEAFRTFWIKPILRFYVSYDYLSAKGFFKTSKNFKPYASFLSLVLKLMTAPDYTDEGEDARKWQEVLDGFKDDMKTGMKYIKVFSRESKRELMMEEAMEALFAPYNLTPQQRVSIMGDIGYDTQYRPTDLHPFLMPSPVYESFVNKKIHRYLQMREAFDALADVYGERKANVPPVYDTGYRAEANLNTGW